MSVTSITIGEGVLTIDEQSFQNCPSLTEVTIPDRVTTIGANAFRLCAGLTNAAIGRGVTNIGMGAFHDCWILATISVDSSNSAYTSVDGVLFNKGKSELVECPQGKAGTVTIPDSVTQLGTYSDPYLTDGRPIGAFASCTRLTSIIIGRGLTEIPESEFVDCTGLTNILIPGTITRIDDSAFAACTSLTSIEIPSRVASVGSFAFADCRSLTAVYFRGDAPIAGAAVFHNEGAPIIYYLPGTMGWGPIFGGRPTAPWVLPYPLILSQSLSFGPQTNGFGFIISWAINRSVVVEVCTNLFNPVWTTVGTNTLINGSSPFSDFEWTNYPNRFYRLRSP